MEDVNEISMPKGAEILCVEAQKGLPCIWALVNPDLKDFETKKIRIVGTGHPIDYKLGKYIGTFQMADGNLIWHCFEED